jgi:virginiamycin A acetyltransferase
VACFCVALHRTPRGAGVKTFLKFIARVLAAILILPLLASFHLRALFVGRDRSLESSSQLLSLLPGLSGQYLRRAFLSRVLAECHDSSCIEFGTIFSRAGARIGKNAYIGPYCSIGLAEIGQDALLASGVQVPSGAHSHGTEDLSLPIREQAGQRSVVRIGNGAWVGCSAVVMADVGSNSIVAAGSVVVRPIPDYVVAAGIPAHVVRSRFSESRESDQSQPTA